MTPEERRLLEETHSLAKDNHRMLRSVRRHQLLMDFGKFAFWIVLLAIAYFGYARYIQPLVETFVPGATTSTSSGAFTFPTSADLQKLINSYKAGQK